MVLVSAVLLAGISACGGGGASSGGGMRAASAHVGYYGGPGTFTMSAPGMVPQSAAFYIVIVINPDDSVVLDPNTPAPGVGALTGNTFVAAYSAAAFSQPGLSCSGVIAVSGVLADGSAGSGGPPSAPAPAGPGGPVGRFGQGAAPVAAATAGPTITGAIGPSTFVCNGVPFTVQGTFTASKFAKAPLHSGTLGYELREAARSAAGQ